MGRRLFYTQEMTAFDSQLAHFKKSSEFLHVHVPPKKVRKIKGKIVKRYRLKPRPILPD